MRNFLDTLFPRRGAAAVDHLVAVMAWVVVALTTTAVVEVVRVAHMLITGESP